MSHSIWQLLAGASPDLLSKLKLKADPKAYNYTNQGGDPRVPTIDDKRLFRDVELALKSMHVPEDDIQSLWKVVAAVIHLVGSVSDGLIYLSSGYDC